MAPKHGQSLHLDHHNWLCCLAVDIGYCADRAFLRLAGGSRRALLVSSSLDIAPDPLGRICPDAASLLSEDFSCSGKGGLVVECLGVVPGSAMFSWRFYWHNGRG